MEINNLALRKALLLFFADERLRRQKLNEIAAASITPKPEKQGGGDFYGPFWSDAKKHALGQGDLHSLTEVRMPANPGRRNLYPQLREGFLLWWNERRRWTNAPYQAGRQHSGTLPIPDTPAVIRVENLLSVIDGRGDEYAVYPFFAPDTVMSDDMARLGLWALNEALSDAAVSQIRLLDVLRGRCFSHDRTPLQGKEAAEFAVRMAELNARYDALVAERRAR